MKKITLTGKLLLKKETIARLNNQQMGSIHGGSDADVACNNSNEACPSNLVECANTTPDAGCAQSSDGACDSNSNGLTCCNGSWNHSSCSGSPCGGGGGGTFDTLERCCL